MQLIVRRPNNDYIRFNIFILEQRCGVMLNKELELALNRAMRNAKIKQHEFLTVEHLLLSLLEDTFCTDALRECGLNVDELRNKLDKFIAETLPKITSETSVDYETQPSMQFQRVLERAVFHVQSAGGDEVSPANVLVAILSEQNSQSFKFLKELGVTRQDIVRYIHNALPKANDATEKNVTDDKNLLRAIEIFLKDNTKLTDRVQKAEEQIENLKREIDELRQACGN